ncbi:cytochrome c biogenesis heme-transporting ATPase CcmA [Marinomonas posidonica]|uniref:cytochrome c biogenesis heme-transporting ATPase CcmA n=1 Tax=Marinomonas posidonica TaxID=936476 RepID=UPI003734DB8B
MQSYVSLTLSNISIERGERDLCKGLSVVAQFGRLYQIVGENGAGKSSLLKVIAGLLRPVEGEIFLDDKVIGAAMNQWPQDCLYLGHQYGIKRLLTVEENIRCYCPNASRENIHSALAQLDLLLYQNTPVKQLSAGQAKRVALSRLWLSDQAIWLLDEPFSSLDVKGRALLEIKLEQQLKCGGLVILTTHQALLGIDAQSIELTL